MNHEETIFEQALAIHEPGEREAYLREACAGDTTMLERLQGLLLAHELAGAFLEHEPRSGESDKPGGAMPGSALAPPLSSVGTGPDASSIGHHEPEEQIGKRGTAVLELEAPADALDQHAPKRIGRYKLLQKIGEGGCGLVYMAEQEEPVRRCVALKVVKLGMDTRQVIARFEAERQALALMEHPHIAKVLDAGSTETGRPYFVMELVKGIPITQYCDENELTTEQRLRLFIQVCQAIQHAHQKGIIHRDLKPSNILVADHDGTPVPKVIDFGIAKATTDLRLTDKTLFTAFEQFIGTPAYMSPEQAKLSGLDVDTRSDIYSLGVLLYELLTGKTPFEAKQLLEAGLDEIRRTILEVEPVRPSTRLSAMAKEELTTTAQHRGAEPPKLLSMVRGDLDWIVMKCLEKDRARRYETANGLATDVQRHLKNEPVVARSPSAAYRMRKFIDRNKLAVGATTGMAVALGLGIVASTWQAVRATQMRKKAQANEQKALAAQAKETAQRQRAEAGEKRGERLFYAGKMNMAQAAWEQNRIAEVRQLLQETADYPDRGFEWYYWQRQTHLELMTLRGHLDEVNAAIFSPDGNRIVSSGLDTIPKVWDAKNGNLLFSLTGHLDRVFAVAISPNGRRIATASRDATSKVWDAANGQQLLSLDEHGGQVQAVNFSHDNRRIVTASDDGTAKIWDATSGHMLLTFSGHSNRVNAAAFSPDGRRVVSGGDDQMVRVWDASTGDQLLPLAGHSAEVNCVAWSPNGRLIASGGERRDPTVRVWDADSGKELLILGGHANGVNMVRFSSDSLRIVTACSDGTAKVWEAATGRELFTIRGHADAVNDAAFSPDGRRIVTASTDHTVKIWDATGSRNAITLTTAPDHFIMSAAISPNGQRIVTGNWDQTATVWDAASGEQLALLRGRGAIQYVAFSPDGQRIATCDDKSATLWDSSDGRFLFVLKADIGAVTRLAFSPDSQQLFTGGADGVARLWEAATGRPMRTFQAHSERVLWVAFSPNGQRLVTASEDQTAKVWDAASGRELLTLRHGVTIRSVAFSPDSQKILTGGADHTSKVWDAFTGRALLTLRGHDAPVTMVAFSPDGRRLLTSSYDQTAKVWDAVTGAELLTLKGHQRRVHCALFFPDGQQILTGGDDATARLWGAATPDQVAAWQSEEKLVEAQQIALAREQAAAAQQARDLTAHDPGAISQWLVLGQFIFEGYSGAKALAQEQIEGEARLRPLVGQHSQVAGSDWTWRVVQTDDYRQVAQRLLTWFGPHTVAYLACYVASETDQTNLLMKVGSQDQSKVYLSGKEIYCHDKPRKFVPDQDVVSGVELKAGLNVVVFKVANEDEIWRASLRFTDAVGHPVKGIHVTLTLR